MRPAIWTVTMDNVDVVRMLCSRTMSYFQSIAAWPWNCETQSTMMRSGLRGAAGPVWPLRCKQAQSCREDQSSAARGSRPCSPPAPRSSQRRLDRRAPLLAATPMPTMPPVAIARIAPRSIPSGGVASGDHPLRPLAAARLPLPQAGLARLDIPASASRLVVHRRGAVFRRHAAASLHSQGGVANGQSRAATRVTRRIRKALRRGRSDGKRTAPRSVYSTPRISGKPRWSDRALRPAASRDSPGGWRRNRTRCFIW